MKLYFQRHRLYNFYRADFVRQSVSPIFIRKWYKRLPFKKNPINQTQNLLFTLQLKTNAYLEVNNLQDKLIVTVLSKMRQYILLGFAHAHELLDAQLCIITFRLL